MRICIIILLLVINVSFSSSQTHDELIMLREQCCNSDHYKSGRKLNDAGEGLVSKLFVVYKVFFSSQDHHSCVFTPSCSEYAVQSIQKQGLFRGTFDTLDRLTRCHSLNPQDYTLNPETKRLNDPVKNIRNEKL